MAPLDRLNEVDFVDLFLGPDFCEAQGAATGADYVTRLSPLSGDVVGDLREVCRREYEKRKTSEFGLHVGGTSYRVTVIDSGRGDGQREYSIRKSSASLRRFAELGLAPHVVRTVLEPSLAGLVLIVGKSGSGKTSTAASLVVERLKRFGGKGWTIEQPIEIQIQGRHGEGRCSQIEVEREEDFAIELRKLLRTNCRIILLGEIRTEAAARTAALAGTNGHLIISTMHAKSVEDGIERFSAMACAELNNARDLVASGLTLVVHQELMPSGQTAARLVTRSLSLTEEKSRSAIQGKIREGRISALNQDIDQQLKQSSWAPSAGPGRP